MAYSRFKTASFGAAFGGLATVGYALYGADNTLVTARTTAGVAERGTATGIYGATVAFPAGFVGEIRWDTGDAVPPSATASEAINPVDEEISSQPSSPASGLVQKTLYLRRQVDGLPADVTSVALADPTGTYGVRRADTGALVIASGVAMAHAGTGVYTFTDPLLSPTVAYQWYAKITNLDGSVEYEPYTSPAASTHYGSREGIEAHGKYNADTAANINGNDTDADVAARYETALTKADRVTQFEAARLAAQRAVAVAIPTATDAGYYEELVEGNNEYALGYLLIGRTEPVEKGKLSMGEQLRLTGRQQIINALLAFRDRALALPGVFQFVEVADPTASVADENSWWPWGVP